MRDRKGFTGIQVKKKPDGSDQALCSNSSERLIMNNQILTEIEVNRKIYLFQNPVERYMAEKTIANSQAVAKAKNELCKFTMQVVS
ncbi:hypothetical protein F897_02005 [Acinetobacter variabilis]|uniref:Uncharacterized protein n=2 Tax=Acinetobacter variabilis TaxID=70346 RepID=N9MJP0_9GAMM|nr:hypothetical protein F897_02005 [Acinetobacter variabilis]